MKGFVHRIFKLLNINGRDWVVLLLSLLLAFSTWIIHKMSLQYSVYLTVEVVADCSIEGHSNRSFGRTEVIAKCRTTGWNALYAYMTRDNEVVVRFPSSVMTHGEDDRYFVSSDKLHEYVDQIFGSKVSVEYFVSDGLYFRFQEERNKRVPIKPMVSLSFADQYMALGPLKLTPDSVTVYGDAMHLEDLEYVTTATILHSEISDDLNGMVTLDKITGMRLSVDDVHYQMDVSRYIEVRNMVPVEIINVPAGKEYVAVPSEVEVFSACVFPLKSDPSKGMKLVADYNDLHTSLSGNVMLRFASTPAGTIRCEAAPIAVKLQEVTR